MTEYGRTCFLIHSLRGGGAEKITVKLANAFAARGERVDLVLGRAQGPYLRHVDPAVRLVDLATRNPLLGFWRLAGYLRRERPPVLVSGGFMGNTAVLALKRLLRLPCRVVVRVDIYLSMGSSLRNPACRPVPPLMRCLHGLAPRLYRYADAVVAVSRQAASDLVDNFGLAAERVHAVYNPALDSFPEPSEEEAPLHPWFGGDLPVALAVGRLHAQKDYPTLLRAFALLRERRPVRLVILGEGPEREALQRLARELGVADRVALPGFSAAPRRAMQRAALYVMSSRWEGLPGALIEALAAGRPVVSTDCPSGPREILDGGRHGALVPCGDAVALAEAMEQALGAKAPTVDPMWLRRFSAAAAIPQYARVLYGRAPAEQSPPLTDIHAGDGKVPAGKRRARRV